MRDELSNSPVKTNASFQTHIVQASTPRNRIKLVIHAVLITLCKRKDEKNLIVNRAVRQ